MPGSMRGLPHRVAAAVSPGATRPGGGCYAPYASHSQTAHTHIQTPAAPAVTQTAGDSCHLSRVTLLLLPWFLLLLLLELLRMAGQP